MSRRGKQNSPTTWGIPLKVAELRLMADKAALDGDREAYATLHELVDALESVGDLDERFDLKEDETVEEVIEDVVEARRFLGGLDEDLDLSLKEIVENYYKARQVLSDDLDSAFPSIHEALTALVTIREAAKGEKS